jgi:hypothetical protein
MSSIARDGCEWPSCAVSVGGTRRKEAKKEKKKRDAKK